MKKEGIVPPISFQFHKFTVLDDGLFSLARHDLRGVAGQFVLYIDGTAISTTNSIAGTVSNISNSLNVNIGWDSAHSSGRNFVGSLDEVRIYNRVLSATEIQQLYNMGR
jgi:hypothetical protein